MAQQDNPYLTITLTGRPPVKIKKEDWPLIASADEDWHDGEVECQANVKISWALRVRLNRLGKQAIVYGTYSYDSRWQNDSSLTNARGGELLEGDDVVDLIPAAIARVGAALDARLGDASHGRDPRGVFGQLVHECTADLPAVEI